MRSDGASGADPPEHAGARSGAAPIVERTATIDPDQTFRYRDASGDAMPIHVDEVLAREVGLPGVIVHGMCLLALCGQAVVEGVAGGAPDRIRRLAARFWKPVVPGSDLTTSISPAASPGADADAYGFVAASGGRTVIRDGRAHVSS
jgi:acyl dehydratase